MATRLAEAPNVNCTLNVLNLHSNRIGVEGAAALAGALRVNCTLKVLDLYKNTIGDEGATAIAGAGSIAQRTGMLVLRRTPIDWRIVKHIIAPYLMNNAGWTDLAGRYRES